MSEHSRKRLRTWSPERGPELQTYTHHEEADAIHNVLSARLQLQMEGTVDGPLNEACAEVALELPPPFLFQTTAPVTPPSKPDSQMIDVLTGGWTRADSLSSYPQGWYWTLWKGRFHTRYESDPNKWWSIWFNNDGTFSWYISSDMSPKESSSTDEPSTSVWA